MKNRKGETADLKRSVIELIPTVGTSVSDSWGPSKKHCILEVFTQNMKEQGICTLAPVIHWSIDVPARGCASRYECVMND